jgi:hypothetical protein
LIKWDLKARSCSFLHNIDPKNRSGVIVKYTGQGDAKDKDSVELLNKTFLAKVLECGGTRAEQAGEDNMEVHHQLLEHAPKIWGAPVLEKIES